MLNSSIVQCYRTIVTLLICTVIAAKSYADGPSQEATDIVGVHIKDGALSIQERSIRVLLSVLLAGAGLFVLNHSIYSFWLSGGPPNEYPQAWYNQGIVSGWRGLALLIAGVFVQLKWSTFRYSLLVKIISAGVAAGILYSYIRPHLLIDSCLDSGGAWDYIHYECRK